MEVFGELRGRPVACISITDGVCSAEILTLGATLRALRVPDRNGRMTDVVLGFDTVEDYVNQSCYIGATVGPAANRIAGARCTVGGRTLALDRNDGENCLHSGSAGLNTALWTVEAVAENAVTLGCTHPDGAGGIPGPMRVEVTYRLAGGALGVEYRAVSECDTICNLTNHSYFNLNGHMAGSIEDHRIRINAAAFTPTDAQSIPTGEIRPVDGTAMDLRQLRRIGDALAQGDEQLTLARGYDHNFVLEAAACGAEADEYSAEADEYSVEAVGDRSGIVLRLATDRPGVQFYTGNYLPEGLHGKGGAVYGPRAGCCLETQAYPDAPHHAGFPSIALPAGATWESRTVFGFSVY